MSKKLRRKLPVLPRRNNLCRQTLDVLLRGNRQFPMQIRVSRHLLCLIISRQFEHRKIKRMETSQINQLKFATHFSEFVLKFCNRFIVQFFFQLNEGEQL